MRPIYLDYNATTPIAPRVQEAMLPFLAEHYGDPASDHVLGRAAAQAIEDARYRVAKAIGAEADEIHFTPSGSTSCRWAGICTSTEVGASEPWLPCPVVISGLNHRCQKSHFDKRRKIACLSSGTVDLGSVNPHCDADRLLLSLPHANSEIGTVQPIRKVSDLRVDRSEGIRLHTDAIQSFGKLPVNVDDLKVDFLSLSSHKIYGPKGVGALYIRRSVGFSYSQEPGMPNVPAIIGFGYAAELASGSVDESAPRMTFLRDRLLAQLCDGVGDDLVVWGDGAERLPNTLAVAFPGVVGDELLAACPDLCATPLASRSGERVRLNSTLRAMKADPEIAVGSVRLSVGWYTDEQEIDRAASMLLDAWERVRE